MNQSLLILLCGAVQVGLQAKRRGQNLLAVCSLWICFWGQAAVGMFLLGWDHESTSTVDQKILNDLQDRCLLSSYLRLYIYGNPESNPDGLWFKVRPAAQHRHAGERGGFARFDIEWMTG